MRRTDRGRGGESINMGGSDGEKEWAIKQQALECREIGIGGYREMRKAGKYGTRMAVMVVMVDWGKERAARKEPGRNDALKTSGRRARDAVRK